MSKTLQVHGLVDHENIDMDEGLAGQALDAIKESLEDWGFRVVAIHTKLVVTTLPEEA